MSSTFEFRNEHGHQVQLSMDRDDDHVVGIEMFVNGHPQINTWLTNIEAGAVQRMLTEIMTEAQS